MLCHGRLSDTSEFKINMCAGFLSIFRRKGTHAKPKRKPRDRSKPDEFGGLSEVIAPLPVENQDGAPIYRHHSLEENIERASRGEDLDAQEQHE